jgi:uncharacterized protein YndB with AHSA1/START domain
MTDTDRIEKKILLQAPRSRVWRALTTVAEFNAWFRVNLAGEFRVGNRVSGPITYPGYEHLKLEIAVEELRPQELFSYRWHPYAVEPEVDYSSEPTTLVEFRLEETSKGTELTIVESGFDALPKARRAEAWRMNDGGWAEQIRNIERHVTAQ